MKKIQFNVARDFAAIHLIVHFCSLQIKYQNKEETKKIRQVFVRELTLCNVNNDRNLMVVQYGKKKYPHISRNSL